MFWDFCSLYPSTLRPRSLALNTLSQLELDPFCTRLCWIAVPEQKLVSQDGISDGLYSDSDPMSC